MTPSPDQEIPLNLLPPGFAESVDEPVPNPVPTRPAATVVVLRDGASGVEALLLRRTRNAGFVPGAFVFPGGRVDAADADPGLTDRLTGPDPDQWARRLRLGYDAEVPATAYLMAALRETFEETGILLARYPDGGYVASAAEDRSQGALRTALHQGRTTFAQILQELDARIEGAAAEYIAHWITPEVEPRRYDTRFFAVRVPRETPVEVDRTEIVEHRWLSPEKALEGNAAGELPMVFPTIHTLRELIPFRWSAEVLSHFRAQRIPTILPRLVRTPTGVGIEVPEPE